MRARSALIATALMLAASTLATAACVYRFPEEAYHFWNPKWSPVGDRIAFVSMDYNDTSGMYVTKPDGTEFTHVSRAVGIRHMSEPKWSPDGSKIAMEALVDGQGYIYVVNPDGTSLTQIPLPDGDDRGARWPRWSPDGSKIAFVSTDLDTADVYVVNPDGSKLAQISTASKQDFDSNPEWSPDGTRVIFTSRGDGAAGIYVVNADGSELTRLIRTPTNEGIFGPAKWSPDGTRIVFATGRNSGGRLSAEVYVTNTDGSERIWVSNTAMRDYARESVWSPDGTRIAFRSSGNGSTNVYVVNANGTGLTQITRIEKGHLEVEWSPDSNMVAYIADTDLYSVKADGSDTTRITKTKGYDNARFLEWSPDSQRIAFTIRTIYSEDVFVADIGPVKVNRITQAEP